MLFLWISGSLCLFICFFIILFCSPLLYSVLFWHHTVSYLKKIKYIFEISDNGKKSYWSGIICYYHQTTGQVFLKDPRTCGNRFVKIQVWLGLSEVLEEMKWDNSSTSRPRHHVLTTYILENLGRKMDNYFPLLKLYLHLFLFKQVKCKYARKRKTDGKQRLNLEWFNMATSPTPYTAERS